MKDGGAIALFPADPAALLESLARVAHPYGTLYVMLNGMELAYGSVDDIEFVNGGIVIGINAPSKKIDPPTPPPPDRQ